MKNDSVPEAVMKSREMSIVVINMVSSEIQGVYFIVSLSTAAVTVDLWHRKPASAGNLDHFETPLRHKVRCASRAKKL
jgi:hypothetical protein